MDEVTLKQVPLFAGLSKKELQTLANSSQERIYEPGTTILKQGDTGVGLYIITKGHAKVTQEQDPDRAEVVLNHVGPGDVLGEMALLDDLPRSANVVAEDEVTAVLLPVWEFRTALRNNPDIAIKLLSVLSHRLRNAEHATHTHG
ncbi:MAG TPA: cyclic nucleotide-binding domain-containing protein [Ktedonobacteraceae bacterium]|nr:cyclic nucleotide-binding domain-containing protein [Ktedonobacteraceae bacterium]